MLDQQRNPRSRYRTTTRSFVVRKPCVSISWFKLASRSTRGRRCWQWKVSRQLKKFLKSEAFQALNPRTPVIVGGDFNDGGGKLGKKILVPAGFRSMQKPLRTFPAWAPMRALDSVYVYGDVQIISVQRSRLKVSRWASDHLPLIAEVNLT